METIIVEAPLKNETMAAMVAARVEAMVESLVASEMVEAQETTTRISQSRTRKTTSATVTKFRDLRTRI